MKSGIARLYELPEIFSKGPVLVLDPLSKEQSRKQTPTSNFLRQTYHRFLRWMIFCRFG